ncbi:MAG: DegT/DnrJ/EryC1/StrS family aminotransferase [Deltaproteobacteria bacterium]|nr:DegT/DnrJ/EryC1/StrS family aminotransferase [Deltaproteobacteria bacterium]
MTASKRTKAILVFHQFGYPQRIDYIEKVAVKKGWFTVNDCAQSLSSTYCGKILSEWGDFAVNSFPKFYHCNLGGALVARNRRVQKTIANNYNNLATQHAQRANQAYEILLRARQKPSGREEQFEIDAVYGYLPEVVAFPTRALGFLPDTIEEIRQDADRRRNLLNIVRAYFPDRVPEPGRGDVVPFAIPIAGEKEHLQRASLGIKERFGIEAPILHFDFARNMLNPDYRKALVIGCHSEWSDELVTRICKMIHEG